MGILITFLSVLFAIICVGLILLVLMQPGRTDRVASMGNAPVEAPTAFTDTIGVSQSSKVLFTWTLSAIFVFFTLVLLLTIVGNARDRAAGRVLLPEADRTPAVQFPASAPGGETPAFQLNIPTGS